MTATAAFWTIGLCTGGPGRHPGAHRDQPQLRPDWEQSEVQVRGHSPTARDHGARELGQPLRPRPHSRQRPQALLPPPGQAGSWWTARWWSGLRPGRGQSPDSQGVSATPDLASLCEEAVFVFI